MVSNQGWSNKWLQLKNKWIYTISEVVLFSGKMDILMKNIYDRAVLGWIMRCSNTMPPHKPLKPIPGAKCGEEMIVGGQQPEIREDVWIQGWYVSLCFRFILMSDYQHE